MKSRWSLLLWLPTLVWLVGCGARTDVGLFQDSNSPADDASGMGGETSTGGKTSCESWIYCSPDAASHPSWCIPGHDCCADGHDQTDLGDCKARGSVSSSGGTSGNGGTVGTGDSGAPTAIVPTPDGSVVTGGNGGSAGNILVELLTNCLIDCPADATVFPNWCKPGENCCNETCIVSDKGDFKVGDCSVKRYETSLGYDTDHTPSVNEVKIEACTPDTRNNCCVSCAASATQYPTWCKPGYLCHADSCDYNGIGDCTPSGDCGTAAMTPISTGSTSGNGDAGGSDAGDTCCGEYGHEEYCAPTSSLEFSCFEGESAIVPTLGINENCNPDATTKQVCASAKDPALCEIEVCDAPDITRFCKGLVSGQDAGNVTDCFNQLSQLDRDYRSCENAAGRFSQGYVADHAANVGCYIGKVNECQTQYNAWCTNSPTCGTATVFNTDCVMECATSTYFQCSQPGVPCYSGACAPGTDISQCNPSDELPPDCVIISSVPPNTGMKDAGTMQ